MTTDVPSEKTCPMVGGSCMKDKCVFAVNITVMSQSVIGTRKTETHKTCAILAVFQMVAETNTRIPGIMAQMAAMKTPAILRGG